MLFQPILLINHKKVGIELIIGVYISRNKSILHFLGIFYEWFNWKFLISNGIHIYKYLSKCYT